MLNRQGSEETPGTNLIEVSSDSEEGVFHSP